MCAINGFNFTDPDLVQEMNRVTRHRGPDDEDVYIDNLLSLGHARLSILDLSSAGRQPMEYQRHGREAMIVFNGEIYNYQEIRRELRQRGCLFKTGTDTEVVLAAYLEYGVDCVKRFNGMWAFCLYDRNKKTLFCSRDRLGVKPFYYYFKDGVFIFSSEIKGVLAHPSLALNTPANINLDAVDLYFSLGFIPAPDTIYQHLFKLEARQNLIFDLRTRTILRQWHYYEVPPATPVYDENKLLEEGRGLLRDAVRLRMRSDVPVGAFLSGGLDSSTVVSLMREFTDPSQLHTFSIGFEGKYDETPYIQIVNDRFHTQHHHYFFTEEDFESLLDQYSHTYDEPFGDYSGFPVLKISELAKRKVTVCLSGDGGDEVFAGYPTHLTGRRFDLLRRIPKWLRLLGTRLPASKNLNSQTSVYLLKEACRLSLQDPALFYAASLTDVSFKPPIYRNWTTKKLAYSLSKNPGGLAEALRLHDLLFNTLPDNFLTKIDRASMAYGLEVRSPFLDYRLAEFGQKIPAEWKLDLFRTKKFMRKLIKDLVPETIIKRGKQGFTPPVENWILAQRYQPCLTSSLELLKKIRPRLYHFYQTKVFRETSRLYTIYKIRVLLFGQWWHTWIDHP